MISFRHPRVYVHLPQGLPLFPILFSTLQPMRAFFCALMGAALCLLPVTAQATPPSAQDTAPPAQDTAPPAQASSATAERLLSPLLNIAYRPDGAVTQKGTYTTFANPQQRFSSPGLNCSGFVLAASRLLFNTPLTVANAGFDRWNDSGPTSPHGHDWDYGWDLVCNLISNDTHKGKARFLTPGGGYGNPLQLDGFHARGYDFHRQGQLEEALKRMRPNHVYLLSFNKTRTKTPHIPLHYHVGLVVLNARNEPLLYQTTTQRKKSYVRNLGTAQGRSAFLKAFANTKQSRKHMAIIEIPMQ